MKALTKLLFFSLLLGSAPLWGQFLGEDGEWYDNNLVLRIEADLIRSEGELYYCIADSSRGPCIENLQTGLSIKLYDANDNILWEGQASGRRRGLKFPQAYPTAQRVELRAFKAWVVSKSTASRIHQEKPLYLNYTLR